MSNRQRKKRHQKTPRPLSGHTRLVVNDFEAWLRDGGLYEAYREGLRIAKPYADARGAQGCPDMEITRFLVYVGTYGLEALRPDDPEEHVFFATPSCGDERCLAPDHQVLTADEGESVLSSRVMVFMKDMIWVRSGNEITDGFVVGCHNGDVFDLRRENLVLVPVKEGWSYPPDGPYTIMNPEECTDLPSYPVTRSQVLAWEEERG